MGFNLNHGDEVIPCLDDQIPVFRRSEIARQGDFFGYENIRVAYPSILYDGPDQLDKAVSVFATRYC